jgi:hypothetical protein
MIKQTKKYLLPATAMLIFLAGNTVAQQPYQPQAIPVQTRWTTLVNPQNALKEYPRPQLVRKDWQNLNGLWEYAITPDDHVQPTVFDGQILVPYPLESALSGVKKKLKPEQRLWYRKMIDVAAANGNRMLLHFGAVDWQSKVYLPLRSILRMS